MAISGKSLADGQLANTTGDLYTVPGSTRTFIVTVIVSNAGAGDNSINLFVKPSGGSDRRIVPKDMVLETGDTLYFDENISLEAGDKLRGDATNASEVDYSIYGGEQAV